MNFTWIEFYKELADKLLGYKNNRKVLIDWIYNNLSDYCGHLKDDAEGNPIIDIDPFTFFALFNRGIKDWKRKLICEKIKAFLSISAPVPEDFNAIPIMNAQLSNFVGFKDKRKDGDVERLWNLFESVLKEDGIESAFDSLRGQFLIKFTLTMGMFWIRPEKYLALDSNNRIFLSKFGINVPDKDLPTYKEYLTVLNTVREKMNKEEIPYKSFPEFSYNAWNSSNAKEIENDDDIHYWTYSPGENASEWQACQQEQIMCIGWDKMGDLSAYSSADDIRNKIQEINGSSSSFKNDVLAIWNFVNEMRENDIVYAKKGNSTIIGRGIVTSSYFYDSKKKSYKNMRGVEWTHVGEWNAPFVLASKTLTDITEYSESVEQLEKLFDHDSSEKQYWWLVGNPKKWRMQTMPKGYSIVYSLYNENGKQRRIFQNFIDARVGDCIIGYESTHTKQVVGLFEVSKESDGKHISFIKTESLATPIDYSELKNLPELSNMQFLKNSQGSFFKLTEAEYDTILNIIREENPISPVMELDKYTQEDFLEEVYISAEEYESLASLLQSKKNIILQGAPGVGKTFCSERLAYSILGCKDESKVELIQFHQNYTYEDFIMGYKPNEEGGFKLKRGIFYNFCKKAESDPSNKYFFIIDEINRGNLSRIFGELMMLIENSHRGESLKLAYSDEPFSVPENIYIIGMMNTADRSLAMIDYALRRRFSFFDIKPGFESEAFKQYQNGLNNEKFNNVIDAVVSLNSIIEKDDSLGSGFCIGHSYFCGQKSIDEIWLKNVVEYDIIPMLREYWFDDNQKFDTQSANLMKSLE